MYPEYESSVNPQVYRPETSVGLDLMGFDDEEMEGGDSQGGKGKSPPESSDKEELILPLSRGGITTAHAYTNLVFEVNFFFCRNWYPPIAISLVIECLH